jgi:hypothetical protein
MKPIYDGNFDAPQPVRPVRIKYPYPEFRAFVIYEQDYIVRAENYAPATLGIRHHIYTNAQLAEEGSVAPVGGGLLQFVRTFCTIPTATYEAPLVTAYTYPAFLVSARRYGYQKSEIGMRLKFTQRVTGRTIHTFHAVDPDYTASGLEIGDKVGYEGFIAEIINFNSHGDPTIEYRDENYKKQTKTVPAYLITAADGRGNANFKDLPITTAFQILTRTPLYNNQGRNGSEQNFFGSTNFLEQESVVEQGIDGASRYDFWARVDYISNYTEPNLDQYLNTAALQSSETKIEQVIGNVYRCSNDFVPAL